MLISRILVAVDASEFSSKVLEAAKRMVRMNKLIELEVVHVVAFPDNLDGYMVLTDDFRDAFHQEGKNVLQDAEKALATLPNKKEFSLLEGRPAYREILDHAHAKDCDFLIVGSGGLNRLQEFFLGSVSHQIVQRAHVPVLIVK